MAINVKESSDSIMKLIGGKENVNSVTHCVTRLRFILKDVQKADTEAIKKTDGVLGVVFGSGQYQIVLGPNLFPVFEYIVNEYGLETEKEVDEYHEEDDALKKKSGFGYYLGKVTQFLSSALTPFITVLYGAGMLKVALGVSAYFWPDVTSNTTYMMFNFMSNVPFYFMPVFIAYGTSRTLKSNPAFAMAMALMLLYPNFIQLVAEKQAVTIFGLPVTLVSYSNTLLPAVLSALLVARLEKFFYRVIPGVLRSVFAPLLTLAAAMPVVMVVLAPLGTIVGNYIVNIFVAVYDVTGGVAIGLLAAVWPFMVMGGMNMLFVAPMTELLAKTGYDNFFRPAWILHNIAEGGACVGVAIRTKNKKLRSEAVSAAIGAIVSGVSEPAIYGINLRLKKPFYAVVAGSVAGGATAGIMGAKAYTLGYSSILAIPIFMDTMMAITIAIAVTFAVSVVTTMVLGFDDSAIPQ
ncbi:MAG: PTS transporter subunit EIIC [Lacrimispora sp.]|uniref:PTS transporter subunit EIIC n=1 Tax=Lacrimispora sp. TaxID=2719234 RepID=UPI0039E2D2E0